MRDLDTIAPANVARYDAPGILEDETAYHRYHELRRPNQSWN
jgi:hypothetical protein